LTTNWSQNNHYDQYGNRQIDYGGGNYNLGFNSSHNQITSSGYSYDLSGNLTSDGVHAYAFDAERRIASLNATTAYLYDGEGHRVKKLVGETTRFIYGIGGQLVAEYNAANGNLKKEYVHGSGIVTIEPTAVNSNGTQYGTGDHLGSSRIVANASGSVVSRHDYMPFGEELGAGIGGRTTGIGFGNSGDNSRKQFTGYERDAETGLDFAQARFYGSNQGRFTSPDPFSASAIVTNPQTFNRYAYVGNDPVNAVDPSGLKMSAPSKGFAPVLGASNFNRSLNGTFGSHAEIFSELVRHIDFSNYCASGQRNADALAAKAAAVTASSQRPASPNSPPSPTPPFDSSFQGTPQFEEANPVPAGVTYTYSPFQTVINQPVQYQDGTNSGDLASGIVTAISISVGALNSAAVGQEFITVKPSECNLPTNMMSANSQPFDFTSGGTAPDEIGVAHHGATPYSPGAALVKALQTQPVVCTVTQEVYVSAPNRGVVLYSVNRITIMNVDNSGRVGAFTLSHTNLSTTSTMQGAQ
jgi:RHS repeat-associated protein